VGVTIVGAVDSDGPTLIRDLQREVVDAQVAPIAAILASDGAETRVIVLSFSDAIDTALCERMVAWAATRRPRPGLIAWSPTGTHEDTETALAAGFDDAVVGSVSARELAARIRAVHRRVHWAAQHRNGRLRHASMMLDTDGHELWIDGRTVALTSIEMSVVRALIRAGGRTLTRSELLDQAWGAANFDVSERAVDNVILRLRRKLRRSELIQTVRGVGFRLHDE
jgi:DNA-binding response OmpR family regulator